MKSLKAAAVVAGSMVIAGAAAPAFANDTSDFTATSLNGALDTVISRAGENLPHAVDNANAVVLPGGLLGGLPLQK